ncbi:MAG TPA: hypothetical protein VK909_03235 [Anaerolineales bacterium]|nr:hypothetical protein [Anaerolineales bacterium]
MKPAKKETDDIARGDVLPVPTAHPVRKNSGWGIQTETMILSLWQAELGSRSVQVKQAG